MIEFRRYTILCAVLIFVTITVTYGYDDGFGEAKKLESQYFAVYYSAPVEPDYLELLLNIRDTDKILASDALKKNTQLSGMLDTLFLRVSDILDMHLYSLKTTIKICRDAEHLNRVYNSLFGYAMNQYSIYVPDLNTIYISPEHFNTMVLGHEIAHSIISHYFVVQPPLKIAEVLAGYVEYQLRRAGQE